MRAAQRIQARAEQRASPRELGDLALLQLIEGRPSAAVETLEKATSKAAGDGALLSDLAAAYIARAAEGNRPYDYVRALAVADRALRVDPDLSEARFNRALALERVPLVSAARRAWQEVLSGEEDPGWKSEARARLRRLTRLSAAALWQEQSKSLEDAALRGDVRAVEAIVDRFPQPARLRAEEALLPEWAAHTAAGRHAQAARCLSIARAIGAALLRRDGDAMLHDAVAAIDDARSRRSFTLLRHLVAGHRSYGVGLLAYQRHDFAAAVPSLTTAEMELRQARSPFVAWAIIYLASSDYFHAHFERTRNTLERLSRDLPAGRYPSLEGRIAWILGSIEILRGRPGDALPRFYEGRKLYSRSGEIDELGGMLQHLAMILGASGRPEEAWRHVHAGLRLVDRMQSPRRRLAAFDEAGLLCLQLDHPEAAHYFQDELLDLALRLREPEMIAGAWLRLARGRLRLGQTEEAREQLAAGRRVASRIEDESLRGRLEAEILTTQAEASLPADPEGAIRLLTHGITYSTKAGYHLDLPMLLFIRARAYLAAGRKQLAGRDFRAGLTEIEAARGSFADPRLRIALQDQSAALFDETLTFLAAEGRGNEAFEVSERGHARQLLETLAVASLSTNQDEPRREPILSAEAITRDVPPGIVLLKYAALEDRLLVWALRREGGRFLQLAIGRAEIAARVSRLRSGLRAGGDRRSLPVLRELYRHLVDPVAKLLEGAREIVFVPDRGLELLPFATLVDPRTGRYLIESRAVVVAPSANVHGACLRRSRSQAERPPESALVIAADGFDRARFPRLDSLHHAASEAKRVAAEYPRHRLLTGREARRDRFLAALAEGPDVVHFTGHGVPNPSLPELSMLVLAPGPAKSDSGAVYSHEIYGMRLDRTRIVVLSACDTAIGKLSASEGALGLARPFLAAGTPAVLATLGPVDDELGSDLMASFHRRLRSGEPAAEALRSAQLSQLAAGGERAKPAHWGFFELIGGAQPP
jgi:CHAT domain-containing protein